MTDIAELKDIKLKDLKQKTPAELVTLAEELEVENASALRKQELMFAILKNLAVRDIEIIGEGVMEVLQDGFGFLRSADANYLAGPDDIYVSPSQIRKFTPADRRHGRGTNSQPERWRAVFCAGESQHDQF